MSFTSSSQRFTQAFQDSDSIDYKAIVESTAVALCQLDREGKIIYVNKKARVLLGYEERDLLGFAFHSIVQPRRINESTIPFTRESPILSVLQTGKHFSTDLDYFRRSDGSLISVSYDCAPVRVGIEFTGVIINFSDITGQTTMDERRRDFVAILAHDLKTPLQGAGRVINMLLNGKTGPLSEGQNTCLTHLSKCNTDILEVIETALDVYRAVKGTADETNSIVDLSQVVRLCDLKLRREAEDRLITLNYTVPEISMLVSADEIGLQHVLMNIMCNAIKFTPEGGTVSIDLQMEADQAVLTVSDSGPGLSDAEIAMLFQPFWQGALGRKMFGGSGLGLYLCRQIVDSFNGSVAMTSTLGKGAAVTVKLPVYQSNSD